MVFFPPFCLRKLFLRFQPPLFRKWLRCFSSPSLTPAVFSVFLFPLPSPFLSSDVPLTSFPPLLLFLLSGFPVFDTLALQFFVCSRSASNVVFFPLGDCGRWTVNSAWETNDAPSSSFFFSSNPSLVDQGVGCAVWPHISLAGPPSIFCFPGLVRSLCREIHLPLR